MRDVGFYCNVYQALYVPLAVRLDVPLWTADRRLSRARAVVSGGTRLTSRCTRGHGSSAGGDGSVARARPHQRAQLRRPPTAQPFDLVGPKVPATLRAAVGRRRLQPAGPVHDAHPGAGNRWRGVLLAPTTNALSTGSASAPASVQGVLEMGPLFAAVGHLAKQAGVDHGGQPRDSARCRRRRAIRGTVRTDARRAVRAAGSTATRGRRARQGHGRSGSCPTTSPSAAAPFLPAITITLA